jgi:hypothetical protein
MTYNRLLLNVALKLCIYCRTGLHVTKHSVLDPVQNCFYHLLKIPNFITVVDPNMDPAGWRNRIWQIVPYPSPCLTAPQLYLVCFAEKSL